MMEEKFWSEEDIINTLVVMIREYIQKADEWSLDELNAMFDFHMEQSEEYRTRQAEYLISECAECVQKMDWGEEYYFIMSFLVRATRSRML